MIFAIIGAVLLAFFIGFFIWSIKNGGATPLLFVIGFIGLLLTVADPILAMPIINWIENLPWKGF